MTAGEWKRLRAILERASELDDDERSAHLAKECGGDAALRAEVESLLEADSRAERLEPPAARAVSRALGATDETETRAGAWKLERELGSGGIGTVWLGQRVEGGFTQRAAVKLIKRGMDTEDILRRFERERALLAELEHPSIARLYDGGSTSDGRPYLVMEFVDGLPFDEYCAQQRVSRSAQLELFARVCDAVHHAHQHLVVHRDLKPHNVLVTADGAPKLLDFGIAKVLTGDESPLASRTRTEARLLTPQYASPEQLRGGTITTRTDVFALGVMLYEVLAGRRPFDGARTPDTEAVPPSRTSRVRGLAGDLDTIVMMALALEPARRYASAAALADDVRRFLAGEPVLARPDTFGYRARKFVRRNRLLVGATLAVIVALAAGLVATWMKNLEAVSARREADARLAGVVRLAGSFSRKLSGRLARTPGIVPQREELLRDVHEQLEELLRQAPGERALAVELAACRRELAAVLGAPNEINAGKYDEAQSLLERAAAEFQPVLDAAPRAADAASVASTLAWAHGGLMQRAHRTEDARADFERAMSLARVARESATGHEERELLSHEMNALNMLISITRDAQQRDVERELSARQLELVELACEHHPGIATFRYARASALINRGLSLSEGGDFEGSARDIQRAAEQFELLVKEDPANANYGRALTVAYYRLSDPLRLGGHLDSAVEAARLAWERKQEEVHLEPQDTAARDSLFAYAYAAGSAALEAGDLDLAEEALSHSLECVKERLARRPEERWLLTTGAAVGTELAAALARKGEWRKAVELAESSLESGLGIEHEPGRGDAWLNGMAVAFSNSAECRAAAARDASLPLEERRAHADEATRQLARAKDLLDTADREGKLGADERTLFATIDRTRSEVEQLLASL